MTTSEYLVELKKLMTRDIKEMMKSGADVSESYFVEKARRYLEKMHLPVRMGGRITIMARSSCAPIVWKEIGPEIEKHISDTLKRYRSKNW